MRMMDRQLPQAWIEIGDDYARLERHTGLPLEREVMLDDRRRFGERLLRLARREIMIEAEIVRLGAVAGRRAGGRGDLHVRHGGQLFPVDRDQLDGVLGLRPGRCDNGDDGFALPADFIPGERVLRRRAVARKWREPRLPWLADRGEVVAGHHRDHAGRLLCRRGVDAADARMRVRAAQKRDMADVGHVDVIGVAPPALGEAPGLSPWHATPDPAAVVVHGLHPTAGRDRFDRIDDRLIAGAAAKVARQCLADLARGSACRAPATRPP